MSVIFTFFLLSINSVEKEVEKDAPTFFLYKRK